MWTLICGGLWCVWIQEIPLYEKWEWQDLLVFQLIDIFGTLLDRPLIKREFDLKYPQIITMMERALDEAKVIYDKNMAIKKVTGSLPVHVNMPKVSGYLKWAQELRERIATPMTCFKRLEHP